MLHLSLNGKDVLNAEDETLVSVGLVSGDAIHILGLTPTTSNITETNPKKGSPTEACEMSATERLPPIIYKTIPPSLCDSSGISSYPELVQKNPGVFLTAFEKLSGLLHILMVETGFIANSRQQEIDPYITLPDSWHCKRETLTLHYLIPYSPWPECNLTIVGLRNLIAVTGITGKHSKFYWHGRQSDFLSTEPACMRRLSVTFKNQVSYPLLLSMQQEVGLQCSPNLQTLPTEILLSICKNLNVKSLCSLAQTCKATNYLCNQPLLWKALLARFANFKQLGYCS